jgi:hypothetical protein
MKVDIGSLILRKCQNVSGNKTTRITDIYTGNAVKPDDLI